MRSAKNVLDALDTAKFEPVLIGIDRRGGWHELQQLGTEVAAGSDQANKDQLLKRVDVVFPVLHGPFGEDGSMQGLLELAGVPYVGCGILASAAGMDKEVTKRLLREVGVTVAEFIVLTAAERAACDLPEVIKTLGTPLFVKPANMGSSVGVSKAVDQASLAAALDRAFQYDRKVLIEKAVVGDEVECAVLGNDQPQVSVPGRLIVKADFYTYEAKYIDDTTDLEIPAKLTDGLTKQVQATALKTYRALGCEGMARVDMFVTPVSEVVVNEVNTIPGFTSISMYPQLWEASGLGYRELITQLIELALERFGERRGLLTTHS